MLLKGYYCVQYILNIEAFVSAEYNRAFLFLHWCSLCTARTVAVFTVSHIVSSLSVVAGWIAHCRLLRFQPVTPYYSWFVCSPATKVKTVGGRSNNRIHYEVESTKLCQGWPYHAHAAAQLRWMAHTSTIMYLLVYCCILQCSWVVTELLGTSRVSMPMHLMGGWCIPDAEASAKVISGLRLPCL